MPPDPRDDEFAARAAKAIVGLVLAVEHRSMEQIVAELNLLFAAIIAHHKTLGERPGDEPLRRAVAALSGSD